LKKKYVYLSSLQVVSLLLSFIAQSLMAKKIGPGLALDAYFSVNGFAIAFIGCVSSGAFYLLPGVINLSDKSRENRSEVAGNGLISTFFLGLLIAILSLFVYIFSVLPNQKESGIAIDGLLIALGWFGALTSLMCTAWGAVGNSQGRAAGLIALGIVPYASVSLYLYFETMPTIVGLATIQLFGNSLQASSLAILYRHHWTFRKLDFSIIRRLMHHLPIAAAGSLCFSGYAAIDAWIAPILGSEVLSHQAFAQRLIIAFGGILATGPFMLSSSVTAKMIQEKRSKEVLKFCIKTSIVVSFICFVAAIATPSLGKWIISILFERGLFDKQDTEAIAANVTILLLGAGPMLSTTVMFRALYNLNGMYNIAILGVTWLIIYASFANFLKFFLGSLALSFAYVIAWWSISILTFISLKNIIKSSEGISHI
jgi:peptidoglycan biosynthesis protein MviN/MurJ (putative lipid II flippase)